MAFYRAPASRIWTSDDGMTPAGAALLAMLRSSAADGFAPERYRTGEIEQLLRSRSNLARAELLLSNALVAYSRDLRLGWSGNDIAYIDRELRPAPARAGELLAEVAASPTDRLRSLRSLNPVYDGLREGLSEYRARWSDLPQIHIPTGEDLIPGSRGERVRLLRERLGVGAPSGRADHFDYALAEAVLEFRAAHGLRPAGLADRATIEALNAGAAHFERIILVNLERARAMAAPPGERYIVVDSAAAKLWLVEDGELRDSMPVIVGRPDMETPELAAFIRFAIINPYWNIPPDLVRYSIAPEVLRQGTSYLARRRLQLLSGWSRDARVLAPEEVDWTRVAAGASSPRVRQLPGGDNMMGRVKFMLPNRLGIYLHDTPTKADFKRSDRRLSSGCIRVQDAERLGEWLFGGRPLPAGQGTAERRLDLPRPVPVYITYFTAFPEAGRIRFQPDSYERDPALIERLPHS